MNHVKRFAVLLAATAISTLSISNGASAQSVPLPSNQWLAVSRDADNNIYQVDKSTVLTRDGITLYWVQILHSNGKVAISRQYTATSCGTNKYLVAWSVDADSQGRILASGQRMNATVYANSGTVANQLINAVCGNDNSNENITRIMLDNLERARETNARAITDAMRAGMEMYK